MANKTGKAASVAKVVVRLNNITWRDGRPRFNPGPSLRALKLKGQDLRHNTGQWFNLHECVAWLEQQQPDWKHRRTRKAEGKYISIAKHGPLYTIETMFEDLWREQSFRQLKPSTQKFYRNRSKRLAAFDGQLWTSPAASLDTGILKGLHEQLWQKIGKASARGVMSALSTAYSNAVTYNRVPFNPLLKDRRGRWEIKKPDPHLRVGTPLEINALIKAADEVNLPEIGDAILLALYTGQRLADILQLEARNEIEGRIRFIQNKTGARVKVRATPQLLVRLELAQMRKFTNNHITNPQIVTYQRSGKAFTYTVFNKLYNEVRKAAEKYSSSVSSFNFKDLRDTSVTRLAMAGGTMPEIASITGHTLASIHQIMKHYLELNEAQADAAIDKLQIWMEQEGIAL